MLKGYTQEEVANRMGFARQTISSYESNRTQPDLETLKRFAELYDAEIGDVLYGRSRQQIKRRYIRVLALVTLIASFLLGFLHALLIWLGNTLFSIPSGSVDIRDPLVQTHMALSRTHDIVEGIYMSSFTWLSLALLVFIVALERPIAPGVKLKYLGVLALGAAVAILPWMLADPIMGAPNYYLPALRNLATALIMFGLSFLGELIYKRINRAWAR